ncbi:hypothetical protein L208DRAFT_643104 [Tricholoma matsutake]|nr:hypothetical protein L208DRAFT_643104 [Tricholoma matsutake 945]
MVGFEWWLLLLLAPFHQFFFSVSSSGILFPPPSRVFLYSSSVRRIACNPLGKDGNPCPPSLSGTSSMVGHCGCPCSQFFFLSVARY